MIFVPTFPQFPERCSHRSRFFPGLSQNFPDPYQSFADDASNNFFPLEKFLMLNQTTIYLRWRLGKFGNIFMVNTHLKINKYITENYSARVFWFVLWQQNSHSQYQAGVYIVPTILIRAEHDSFWQIKQDLRILKKKSWCQARFKQEFLPNSKSSKISKNF